MPIPDDKSRREARLAEALRTNLRRRKAAARPAPDGEDRAAAAAVAAPQPYSPVRCLVGLSHRDGRQVTLRLELSVPYGAPHSDEVCCAVRLSGDGGAFDTDHGKAAFGVDGLQATQRAIALAQVALDLASTGFELSWPDGRPYDLSAPI
ncbi:hypothetical protein [Caulobacter henricii]|uniref:Uncharacterized protein n=1 Tax=Caulobacter henricii TaxID=69395 RepID=A0A0P0NXQ2_9CAUL|nr:hypothetical protein [Caulobacter henricii]ALL12881.1 hypothetical protein AQ619_05655 [Caulobacter henricii]